jgi:hypothetical protein
MKTAFNAASALALCALLLAGGVVAQTQLGPPGTPETAKPPPPGILLTPPRPPQQPDSWKNAPANDAQPQSCPDPGNKLGLIV